MTAQEKHLADFILFHAYVSQPGIKPSLKSPAASALLDFMLQDRIASSTAAGPVMRRYPGERVISAPAAGTHQVATV